MVYEERSVKGDLSVEFVAQANDMYGFFQSLLNTKEDEGILIFPDQGEILRRVTPALTAEAAAAWAKQNGAVWLQQGRFTGQEFYDALTSFEKNRREDREPLAQEKFDALRPKLQNLTDVAVRVEEMPYKRESAVIAGHLRAGERDFSFEVDYHGGSTRATPEIMLVTQSYFCIGNLGIKGYALAVNAREFASLGEPQDDPRAITVKHVLADAERSVGRNEHGYMRGSFALHTVKSKYDTDEGRLVYMSPRDVLDGKHHIEEDIRDGKVKAQTLDEMMPIFMDVTRKIYRIAHAESKDRSDQVDRYLALASRPARSD